MSQVQASDLMNQGVEAAKAGEKERARQLLLDCVRLDPANDGARLWLASVAASPLEALKHLEQVLRRNPGHEKALSAARATRIQAGVAAAKEKNAPLARSLLRRAVQDDPACEKAWVWLASVVETPDEASESLEKALAINPNNERTRTLLEAYRANPQEVERHVAAAVAPSEPVRTPSRTVLLVEDNATVQKMMTFALKQHGYNVRSADDAPSAIADLRAHGMPDLILLDVSLPGMDGFELCKFLGQDRETRRVPVVLLTDQSGLVASVRARLAGARETVTKSLEVDGLLKVVDRICGPNE